MDHGRHSGRRCPEAQMVRLATRRKRLELRLPLSFAGRDGDGVEFSAQGRSLDVSGAGIRFETRHRLDVGTRLLLEMPVPEVWRAHFGDREVYRVYCVVRRVATPEGGALHQVGAQFVGEPEPV
jgi:hypothetical protein